MPEQFGTRTRQGFAKERIEQGSITLGYTRDNGMRKNVSASLTFATAGTITGANGTFTGTFAVGDDIMVESVNLNNGFFRVTGLDATNAAYLTVDPPPKAEGPIAATVRTP
jgi:hypothetical protein